MPQFVSLAIDKAIRTTPRPGQTSLLTWTLLIIGAGLIAGVFTGFRRYIAFREARLTETNLREEMFAHLQRLHFAFHDEAQTDRKSTRLNSSHRH